jgi:hypothetical protein
MRASTSTSTSTNASAKRNPDSYAIECQLCGHAWLADAGMLRAGGRAVLRCPACEPLPRRALATPAASSAPTPTRLSPELSGKTWVITRARRTRG